ncbi:MAG: 50S ribosomal protein L11 methyltransferase [Alphaproteobacteria bacterium]|nr:50S ribosomal protein L11 methyltransferase [Alphaproteobacteria bacterium]
MLSVETEALHPSTASCLGALSWLHATTDCQNVLDMGCGNGILSAVAASLWHARVTAADIAEQALKDSHDHLSRHGLLEKVTLLRSDGFTNPEITRRAPYDVIICNLLAELQIRLARDCLRHLSPGGHLILSGIMQWKLQEITMAYKSLGFAILHHRSSSPWDTLVLRHTTVT